MKSADSCGCGHEHAHHSHDEHEEHHDHEHHHHDEHCGCGCENHDHEDHEHEPPHHHEHCSCGCEDHKHEHHEHEHLHHHDEHCGCGCGDHEHHGHSHNALTAKRVYILENLGCAHCASKMEERIQALEGVESATITFATKQLRLGLQIQTLCFRRSARSAHPLSLKLKLFREIQLRQLPLTQQLRPIFWRI